MKHLFVCFIILLAAIIGDLLVIGAAGSTYVSDESAKSATDTIVEINQAKHKHLFEGDIVLTDHDHVDKTERGDVDGPLVKDPKRNAQRARQGLWKTKVIPYEISPELADYIPNIMAAINEFHQHTCIRWKPHKAETNWVKMMKDEGCWSRVGVKYWTSGAQVLSLGDGCNHKGTIMHEMMHASGFWHEQSRPDRNNYVEIMWENIEEGKAHNFNKYDRGSIDSLNINYDYDSLMHYGKSSFSKNGKPTIQVIGDPSRRLGQRDSFSSADILELNALYDCSGPLGGWSNWGAFGPCSETCYKYRQRFCTAEDKAANCPGADMFGIEVDEALCTQEECNVPINGHWGRWSSWGECSRMCGDGVHTRTRLCDDPMPRFGGKTCQGVSRQSEVCKARACGLGPDDCEFEVDMCGWAQELNPQQNKFRWIRWTGPTPSGGTGPKGDHTTGSGYYVYAEASGSLDHGQKANLVSKVFPPTSGRCLKFFYSMHGSGMGMLQVFVQESNSGKNIRIFFRKGSQGKSWIAGNATINSINNYKVVFQVVRGPDFLSDVGLDDISFKEHACGVIPTVATTTQQHTSGKPASEPKTTQQPTTEGPTTRQSTTEEQTSHPPTTKEPTTKQPTTEKETTEPPTTEEPANEKPTTEVPTTKKPTTEKPTTEGPTSTKLTTTEKQTTKKSTTEGARTRQTTTDKPATQQPTTEKPTTDKAPTTEQPTTKKPTTEEPITEKPTTQQPLTEKPTTEEPETEKSTSTKPTTKTATTQRPTTEKNKTQQPTTKEQTTKQPTTRTLTTKKPITKIPTTTKLITERLTTTEPITKRPTTKTPITKRPTTTKPITKRPMTTKPTTERPTTTKPITKRPTTRKPTTKPKPTVCFDENTYCHQWASAGHCRTNPGYMHKVCKRSCRICGNVCMDHNMYCRKWAWYGYCKTRTAYMWKYCALSCNKCGYVCKDAAYASWCFSYRNYCKSYKVRHYCHKTCGVCN
ncbi:zonadhesin isoform X2 [Nematostella vectensis]|uniref:zonadhesin isoform X2 n=1 Tax=Nematostella vectensis TaxID=45351 RepID=UPI002077729D|nr:zonadhesin isoform X2 [Nematostella vectensis]